MKLRSAFLSSVLVIGFASFAIAGSPAGLKEGSPEIRSMSALAFGPEGVLFIGDGKGGAVFALATDDKKVEEPTGINLPDLEATLASLLGTTASEVMIHDLAVHPLSHAIYVAVSRGRARWDSRWLLPNDIADATILLRIESAEKTTEISLDKVAFARAALTNPVDAKKMHMWKEEISLRADTVTDMVYSDGTLFVAGLSNEEFASTLWRLPYPFADGATASTLEIYHGAHGEYETHAPIRTFVPYDLNGKAHLLAAYLCTPFVTFEMEQLKDGRHVKGRTIGEFGSGNYPTDMVVVHRKDKVQIVIANTNLPMMLIDVADIESFEGEIDAPLDTYVAGVEYQPRSGAGIQQMDLMADRFLVTLQRLPGGTLELASLPLAK